MDFEHLKIIRALVEDPHLSRTAARLHLNQSAVSKRVQAIETELGFPLFERRGPRGLKPLPAALDFARTAEEVMRNWEAGLRRLQRAPTEPDHFVLVGPQLVMREVVLPWWVREAAKFPRQELEARTSSISRVSLETVQAGADAGILEHKEELANYVCKPFYSETWGIVRHPSKRHENLADYRWGTYSLTENPVDTWIVKRARMPTPIYRIYWQDLTALTHWVAASPGSATVLPWHAAKELVDAGRLRFEPLGRDAVKPLFLAYPRNSPHKALIQSLLAHGRAYGESLEETLR
ncbi:MAG: LysR family transcriptional regulator [Bdellovibrionales bacterium]|nr:LysR family transcriptional regulator [Bdellovibrionales bacterium]